MQNESYKDIPMAVGKSQCDQKRGPLQEVEGRRDRENELAKGSIQKKKRERDELLDFGKSIRSRLWAATEAFTIPVIGCAAIRIII